MNRSSKNTNLFNNTAMILCAVFLVCFVSSPSIYRQPGKYSSSSGVSGSVTKIPKGQDGRFYLTSDTGNELFYDIEYTLTTNRSIQRFQNIIFRVFYILLPFAGFCLLVCYFGHFNRKKTQQKHILSTSTGGHAPPQK